MDISRGKSFDRVRWEEFVGESPTVALFIPFVSWRLTFKMRVVLLTVRARDSEGATIAI
jgi:hypothetical protein